MNNTTISKISKIDDNGIEQGNAMLSCEPRIDDEFIGKRVAIRTITMIYLGYVEWVTDREIKLTQAIWVADTANWSDFTRNGKYQKGEPYHNGTVRVARDPISDWCEIDKADETK